MAENMATQLYRSSENQLRNLELGAHARRKGEEARKARMEIRLTQCGKEKLKAIAKAQGLSVADLLEGIATGEFLLSKGA